MQTRTILSAALAAAFLVILAQDYSLRAMKYQRTAFVAGGVKMTYYRKRAPWISGPSVIVPDQVCARCKRGVHSMCLNRRPSTHSAHVFDSDRGYIVSHSPYGLEACEGNPRFVMLRGFQCTCEHESYVDESE